jgi:O-antigen ligase
MLAVFLGWCVSLFRSRRLPGWRTPLTIPWLAFMVASFVSALIASADRSNALHAVGRLGLAFGVYLATVAGVSSVTRFRGVLVMASLGGAGASLLLVLDYARVVPVLRVLEAFRMGPAVVGAQVRASGPFQYPTIASMYLEIVFALILGLLLVIVDAGKHRAAAVVVALLVLMAEAVALTFTRAGLITVLASLVIVGGLRYRRAGLDRGMAAVALVAVGVALLFVTSRSVEAMRLRLTTEGQEAWYRATIDAPLHLTMQAGSTISVPVKVTNAGRMAWTSDGDPRFRFSYHWLLADEDQVVSWEAPRTSFKTTVPPGVTVLLDVRLEAPEQPGSYRVLWDVEQERRLWFSTEPGASLFATGATVRGPATAEAADRARPATPRAGGSLGPQARRPLPKAAVRPGRLVLWRAAMRMFLARPVVGVGPDNFRLRYGSYAGLAGADARAHSNNMYLEVLAGGGLLGMAGFLWLFWRSLVGFISAAFLARDPQMAALGASVAAAGAAIAVHGLVDSFLSFTAIYILSAITLGLAVACGGLSPTCQVSSAPPSNGRLLAGPIGSAASNANCV